METELVLKPGGECEAASAMSMGKQEREPSRLLGWQGCQGQTQRKGIEQRLWKC